MKWKLWVGHAPQKTFLKSTLYDELVHIQKESELTRRRWNASKEILSIESYWTYGHAFGRFSISFCLKSRQYCFFTVVRATTPTTSLFTSCSSVQKNIFAGWILTLNTNLLGEWIEKLCILQAGRSFAVWCGRKIRYAHTGLMSL